MHKSELEAALTSLMERVLLMDTDDFLELTRACALNPQTDFVGADLRSVNLRNVDLRLFNFNDCDLRDANLEGADLRNVPLNNADLRCCNLRNATLEYAQLKGALLNGADLRGAFLADAVLSDASLEGAKIRGAKLVRNSVAPQSERANIVNFIRKEKNYAASSDRKRYHKAERKVAQKTIKNSIHASGIGMHSGVNVGLTMRPAPANTGIVFRRMDEPFRGAEAKANWSNAIETPLRSALVDSERRVMVSSIEALMSALAGCGIDNAIIEVNGPEVPVMDGSSAPFVFLIECAGTVEQDEPRRVVRILKEVQLSEGNRFTSISPSDAFLIDFTIDFETSIIGRQSLSFRVSEHVYKQEISRARTFGFLHEIDQLRAMDLALGGSLDNAIVISGNTILNPGGLRYEDEFVRHKVQDCIGDLYLAGAPILGRFRGVRSGHASVLRLLKALFSQEDAWRLEEMFEENNFASSDHPGIRSLGSDPAVA